MFRTQTTPVNHCSAEQTFYLSSVIPKLESGVYNSNDDLNECLIKASSKCGVNYTCDLIATSKMLGKIVSSGKITDLLITEIKNLNEYTYISENIQFENTYDSEGNVSQYGELYYIFNGLKLIGTKGDAELVNSLLPKEGEEGFNFDAVKSLAEIITEKDENGYSVADYLIESDLFHSVVSAFMVEQSHSSALS